MTTVRKFLGLRPTNGLLGVEIEVEGRHLPQDVPGWQRHGDGSLRGEDNAEYVLPKPLSLRDSHEAINVLWGEFKRNKSRVDDSFRAGVHVHLNVQDLNPVELFTLITLYFVLEHPLTKYCGEDREGNHFCLRSSDAEYLTYMLAQSAETNKINYLGSNQLRYSALNVTSLFKYGSLEFRAMRSTAKMEPIMDWCGIIARLKEASYMFRDPVDVMHSISQGGEEYFVQRVFGPYAKHFLKQRGLGKSIRTGLLNAQDIAFARDWEVNDGIDLNIFRKEVPEGKKFF